ncbi:serine hydrolase domain-containing protein [Hoeflea sp. TYP-13]|uniref:serine hydrolase domain-containing protein n=1 Tax=Hoeflea sp. TYP-13 TaxID=3230023 RepID=UPI0034C65B3D
MAARQSSRNRAVNIRRVLLSTLLLVFLAAAVVFLAAPYLPRLLYEGYPAQRWPASGSHVTVAGSDTDPLPDVSDRTGPLGVRSKALFEERGGHAMLIWQGGELRTRHFSNGADANTRFNSFSMVKSLIGALILRAHADGLIADLSNPIGLYLSNIGDDSLRRVPIERFLTMRSGVALETVDIKATPEAELKPIEDYALNPFSPLARLHMEGLAPLATDLRSSAENVGRYDYQNVNTAILGRLVSTLYKKPLELVLSDMIWKPSGAGNAFWRTPGPDLPVSAYCCLFARPGDWVRVGVFLMHNGTPDRPFLPTSLWNLYFGSSMLGEQLVSGHYGTHVFHNILDRQGEKLQGPFTYMIGRGGQMTYMMPQQDLVVVRFGEGYPLLHSTLYGAWDSIQP